MNFFEYNQNKGHRLSFYRLEKSHISHTIKSVINQTFQKDFEISIIDVGYIDEGSKNWERIQ